MSGARNEYNKQQEDGACFLLFFWLQTAKREGCVLCNGLKVPYERDKKCQMEIYISRLKHWRPHFTAKVIVLLCLFFLLSILFTFANTPVILLYLFSYLFTFNLNNSFFITHKLTISFYSLHFISDFIFVPQLYFISI